MTDGTPTLGRGGLSHRRPANLKRFLFGAAYYPEHWPEEFLERDADRMAAAGFNAVRMAEFAWDLMEPEPGRLDFSLFDRAITTLATRGISAVLCTPTATPPRWLTAAHPEMLGIDAGGRPMQHGSRQHVCHADLTFREHSRRITGAMAEHFAANENVIGWQTDNEFHCHFSECHCRSCQEGFQGFLRRRFAGDVDALNRAWGTAFWAQTYTSFEQVPTPRERRPALPNPGHVLDYYRYLYDLVAGFQHEQVEILRRANPGWFIFHNGTMPHVDYRGLFGRDLDFMGYDVYPLFVEDPGLRPGAQAWNLDRTRAWSGNFFVPEHQSGPGGQSPYMLDSPEPGEVRRMTYTSVARGADSLLYFRWRTCRFGAEQYWCGILDHDDVPRRRYDEVAQIGRELRVIGPEVLGTSVHVDAAVAAADVGVADAHSTSSLGLPRPDDVAAAVHGVLHGGGYAVGCVHPSDDLSGLKLYVVPHWALFDPGFVPRLDAFAGRGGTLVIGARTATRDLQNRIVAETPPGCLAALAGVKVEEYGRRNCADARPLSIETADGTARSELWYEVLAPADGTDSIARWRGRHLDGVAAVSHRRVGSGNVVYVGTYLTEPVFELLLPALLAMSGLEPLWPATPEGVSVVLREGRGKRLWFFINETEEEREVAAVPPGEFLAGPAPGADGKLALGRNDVTVIRESR